MHRFLTIVFLVMTCYCQAQKPTVQIDHVSLPVKNLDSSIAFYDGLFTLDTLKNPFPGSRVRWYSLGGGIQLHLIEDGIAKSEEPLFQHICLSIGNIESFIATLKSKKITYYNGQHVAAEINRRADGVQQLFIQDPDGYWIEVNNHVHNK